MIHRHSIAPGDMLVAKLSWAINTDTIDSGRLHQIEPGDVLLVVSIIGASPWSVINYDARTGSELRFERYAVMAIWNDSLIDVLVLSDALFCDIVKCKHD